MSFYVHLLALHTPQGIAVYAFFSIYPWRFHLQNQLEPVFTCIGSQILTYQWFQIRWLYSHGLVGKSKPLPGMYHLLHANSCEEPHVRGGYQVGPRIGKWTLFIHVLLLGKCKQVALTQHASFKLNIWFRIVYIQATAALCFLKVYNKANFVSSSFTLRWKQ